MWKKHYKSTSNSMKTDVAEQKVTGHERERLVIHPLQVREALKNSKVKLVDITTQPQNTFCLPMVGFAFIWHLYILVC